MHIAIVTTSFPEGQPGSEAAGSFVADFAQQLAGHARVTVVAAGSAASTSRESDVEVVRFTVPRLPLSLLRPWHPADWPAIVGGLHSGKKALQQLVRSDRPDFLFALWALPSGHWVEQAARQQGIPFAVWALGSDIWSLGRIPLVRTRLRGVLRAANVCYADGLQLANDVESISGRNCRFLASSRMLPDPVRNEETNKAPYKFAYLGRWHENKGVDLLVDALGQLEGRDWEGISQIRICGGGPLQDHVFSGVDALRRKGRPVTTGGYLDKQSAADLIGWADYLLLPSRIESIPVIFSDAVQLRTPIIATPVGDLPRLFDKYGVGLLAEDVDAASIAHAIRQAQKLDAGAYGEGLDAAAADFDTANIAAHFAQHARQALDE